MSSQSIRKMLPHLQVLIVIISASSSLAKYTEHELLDKKPPCNHDEVAAEANPPYIVDLASQGERPRVHKRQLSYSNIRIHPVFTNIASTATAFVQGVNTPLSRAIDTLESLLLVRPVQGNLIIPPTCTEYTYGLNAGKCRSPLPSQSNFMCGAFGVIPLSSIGTREVCTSSYGSCTIQGPNGTGLPNADYLLFVSASSTLTCSGGTLAYASYCMLDISDNNRPVAGYINICPSALDDLGGQLEVVYGLFMHEIIHALGFSSRLFDKYVDADGNNYNPARQIVGPYGWTYAFTGPKTVAFARQYYACDDIQGVYLENQGGSGTASSHWEKRTLHHEVMNGYISSDYMVMSEFTLALFEDSGWYKANYTALHNLKQNSLQWGKDLGCDFLMERCTNESVFPYLCDTSETQLVCTYDHLTKGNCSTRWGGFDGCPVAISTEVERYCRTEVTVDLEPCQYVETYSDKSICVDGVRSLSSHSCGTYIRKPVLSLCVAQDTYRFNGSKQYSLQFEDKNYECEDGHALITDNSWVLLCPPNEEIVSRSPSVLNRIPILLPATRVAATDLGALGNVIHNDSEGNVVAFGKLITLYSVSIRFHVNTIQNNGTTAVCQLLGCTTCTAPIMVDNRTSVLSADKLYSVARGMLVASAVFTDSLTRSSDYTLVLMFDPQANHSFVYYAASIDFIGDYLQTLHSNDNSVMRITALTSNTEIRIAPSQDVNFNGSFVFHGEEITFILDNGESLIVSSNEDLTGSRVTANRAVSLYSGHYCAPGRTTSCSILNEQILPYNSWGNTFALHTNVSGLRGNMFKIIASDVGANVMMNCTTDGTSYEVNSYNLGYRQHTVLSVSHNYCIVRSDENILIIQFRDSSPPLMDTFMTIIPSLVHYEDYYVFNAYEDFTNYITITVKDTNITNNSIMINNSPVTVRWEIIELDGDEYHFSTLMLTSGRHTITFSGNFIKFGAIIYGSNISDMFALPAGIRLNLTENLPHSAPLSVENLLVTLDGSTINITWTPPVIANGIIVQYIVRRLNSSGKSYHHVSGNQNYLELPYFNDALVFVAAVNQYGQSSFEMAKSNAPCLPSPCINNGTCVTVNGTSQRCVCSASFFGLYCESTQKLYPFGLIHNDTMLPPSDDSSSSLILLSDQFTFYNRRTSIVYVNTNGIVSLDSPFTLASPSSLPLSGAQRIMAPYWADVDTRGTGQIFYRQSTDPSLLARASNEVQAALPDSDSIRITNLFIATWDAVGYYFRGVDKTNTFQCILADSQYESFVMFLYADIEWTSGGGAVAGINAGDGINHVTIPGSRTSSILNIRETSNVGVPGVWIFRVGEECQPSIRTCESELYPFGLTHGDAVLPYPLVGEGSSPSIYLSRDFYFYDDAIRVVYVNDNGVISFNSRYNVRTPLSLPLSGTQQIIAPYWADVDTRGTGQVLYRQSTDPSLLARASREIQAAFSLTYNIEIRNLLISTWNAVGYYYRKTDKVNTFQCILATSELESFVMFLYADLQWTTGDNSFGDDGLGAIEALAGFNGGDQINSYTIPGSRTSSITNIARISNVGIPGTWIFKVGQAPYNTSIVTSPVGFPVDGVNNTNEYLVGSNLSLTCLVSPPPPVNTNFSWNCSTGCFDDMKTEQTINVTDLNITDSGSITCSFSINNVDYHSEPLNLVVSDFISRISAVPTNGTVGSPQDIACLIVTASGVDFNSVTHSWIGPNSVIATDDDRLTINDTTANNNTYITTLHFNHLVESDEGVYTCNVTTSDHSVSLSANLSNLTIPSPTINISVPNNLTTGQPTTLDCTAVTVNGITSRVDIVWYDGTTQLRRVNNVTADIINSTAAVYRNLFNISSLTRYHDGRVYQCQVIINSEPPITSLSSIRLNVTYVCIPDADTICFYPYGYGEGDSALPTSLPWGEGSSPSIYLRQNFIFYGQNLRTVYVNDNGVISFNSRYNVRTPLVLPLSASYRIIAPYWADVDTRGGGTIYYRQTSDSNLLAKAVNEIRRGFSTSQNVSLSNLLIATWDDVGYYYNSGDKRNTFQCVLASGTSESFAIFLYKDLQWTTGSSSGGRNGVGGTEALVGINAGDRTNAITVPGSRTPNITNVVNTSNIDIPGIWMFKVDRYTCRAESYTCISEFYPFGVAQGDTALPTPVAGEGSSTLIILNEDFLFYDNIVSRAYVNDNGVISFNYRYNVRTPLSLPLSGTQQIIAPYWADVDTRGTGEIYYRQSSDPSLLARASREIQAAFPSSQNVTIKNLLIATWDEVGYYFQKDDKTNTFQCILATSGNESFVIFMYADGRIQWTTGDWSGGYNGLSGTEALAGINAGDRSNSYTISGSRTSSIIYIARTSNVGKLGTWIFKVGETCQTEFRTCSSELYPFGTMNGDTTLSYPYVGEGSSSAITLTRSIYFYNEILRTAYVNDNGVISFNSRYNVRTPLLLPLSGTQRIIAPYWADVDTRGTGQIFYRQTTNATLLARATNEIRAAFPSSENVTMQSLLIATWSSVGYYYLSTDKTNTFQCVLATGESESVAIFLYADLQWTTGDNSFGNDGLGGTEALAGINAGDGVNSVTIPGSRNPNITNLVVTSNIGNPGVWMYKLGQDNCQTNIHTCVSELYPFGTMNGDTVLPYPYSGERSSTAITLTRTLYFYNEVTRLAYVNDNGVISFNSPYNVRTPLSLPLSGTQKIIAPYWADVDTRGTGQIFYRQTTNATLLARATSEIQVAFPSSENMTIQSLLIATWSSVGYYSSNFDKTNTFQCVLATSESESFAIFLYADLQWTTGDDSFGDDGLGGTEALAGINAGDGVNSVTIPGSRSPNITNLVMTSNVGNPGVWIFKIGQDNCQPNVHTCLSEFYPFGVNQNDAVLERYLTSGEGSSQFIYLSEIFLFYDESPAIVYVNDNGVISFNSPYNVRTPLSLPLDGTEQIIAPYWADVDTREVGQIFYRPSTDPTLLARASQELQAAFPRSQNLAIRALLIATWVDVGYFSQSGDKTNTFQCILATSGNESFVTFMYADGRIQWTTGDWSGGNNGLSGTEALAGINAGDRSNSYIISGSRTPSIINIARTSNVGIPGVWMFQVGRASPKVAPSNFRIIDSTSTSVTFQWDPLSSQQANGPVKQYVITCTETSAKTEIQVDVSGTNTWVTVAGMYPLNTYECTIHAVTVLDGPASYPITVTTHSGRPGTVNFHVSSLPDDTKVKIDWLPLTDQNTIITSYQVVYSLYQAVGNMKSVRLNSNTTSYVLENLLPGVPYQARVTAFSYDEMGEQIDYAVFFSRELSPIKTPDDINFIRLSPTSINVTWTPLSLFEAQGFPIYKVTLNPTPAEFSRKRQASSSVYVTENSFALFTNLISNQDYSVTLGVATDASSDFTSSQPITTKVAENEPTTTSETSANHSGEDSSDGDSSGAPTIATGIIAAIAIVALIVIGVILGACYLRRKKTSHHKVTSEPVAIANKVASDEMDQRNNEAGKQQAVEQHIYVEPPTTNDSLTIRNKNVCTSKMEQIEMQRMEQKTSNHEVACYLEPVTIANKAASDEADQQNNEAEEQSAIQQHIYNKPPATNDSLTIENKNTSTDKMEQIEMQKDKQ